MSHATQTPVPAPVPATDLRQKLLFLYLANTDLHSAVVAWSTYDGTSTDRPEMDDPDPPYATAVAAMRDGWRVIQVAPMRRPPEGQEFELGYLKHEIILEKLEAALKPAKEVTA